MSIAKTSSGSEMVDLSALVGHNTRLDDHSPTPPVPAPPLPRRRPPPARPREPGPAPAARRLCPSPKPDPAAKWLAVGPSPPQSRLVITLLLHLLRFFPSSPHPSSPSRTWPCATNSPSTSERPPAEAPHDGSPVLGRAGQSLDRLEAGSAHRVARHRPAMAAPTLPRVLDPALGRPEAALRSIPKSPPSSGKWPRRIPCGVLPASTVGSRAGAVPHRARLQPPPGQTARTDFPYAALLPTSRQGLCDLSAGRIFRHGPTTPDSREISRASCKATPYSTGSSRSPVGPSPPSDGAAPSARPTPSRRRSTVPRCQLGSSSPSRAGSD